MKPDNVCRTILDGLPGPVVFVDTDHIIRYMNTEGADQYEKSGGYDLIGQSIMDCHNDNSCRIIREVFDRMVNEGLDDVELYRRPGKIAYMTAVRDKNGELLGYYERYEVEDCR